MTIVDSLKAKGSTGGNNIAEAIKNLPEGGGEYVVNIIHHENDEPKTLDKTFDEIFAAIKSGFNPVIIWTDTDPTDPNWLHQRKYIYSNIFMGGSKSSVRSISFVNTNLYISSNVPGELNAGGDVYAIIVFSDDTLHYVGAEYSEVYLDY